MHIDVAPTADVVTSASVAAATVLVIDVLRASTTIIAALTNGCRAIVPVLDAETARRAAYRSDVLRAGERRGEPIEGFEFGNSPMEFATTRVRGKTVVMTTSNGTRALVASRGAPAVGVAALVNASAAAAWAAAHGRDVLLVCAGERGVVSLEDYVCAGLIADRLASLVPGATLSAAAEEAAAAGRRYAANVARLRHDSSWARHLIRTGRGADVDACLALDTATLVPIYRASSRSAEGVDEIVGGPG